MRRWSVWMLTGMVLAALTVSATSEPPERPGGGPPNRPGGGSGGPGGRGPGQGGPGQGGPIQGGPRFELGQLLPPQIREELKLTPEQQTQLAGLEKEVKEKLNRLLTDEQKKAIQNFRPRPPRGPGGQGGQGGRPARPEGPPPEGDEDRPPPPRRRGGDGGNPPPPPPGQDEPPPPAVSQAGIQWFGTLERGLAEAKRTRRPILFLAATPHCSGVPGIW